MTNTLDYALHPPRLDNNRHAFVSLFHSRHSRCIITRCIITRHIITRHIITCHIITRCIIIAVSPGLSTTSHRLLSSTEWKNHEHRHMTSDAALVFSSCPDNTPMKGLRQFCRTNGLDLVRVFYVTAPPQIVESALVPYSYPGFCITCSGFSKLFSINSYYILYLGCVFHDPAKFVLVCWTIFSEVLLGI